MDTRIIHCPSCNGDGGFESMPYGYNHINGSPLTHWNECTRCGGRGEVEIEAEPVSEDDLDADDYSLLDPGYEPEDDGDCDYQEPAFFDRSRTRYVNG